MNMENIIATRPNKVVFRDGDRVIKVFNEDFSKADILNEALNQARIEETGLNIPKILGVTMVEGEGMYTRSDCKILICIVRKRHVSELIRLLRSYPDTFTSFSKVNEVFAREIDKEIYGR